MEGAYFKPYNPKLFLFFLCIYPNSCNRQVAFVGPYTFHFINILNILKDFLGFMNCGACNSVPQLVQKMLCYHWDDWMLIEFQPAHGPPDVPKEYKFVKFDPRKPTVWEEGSQDVKRPHEKHWTTGQQGRDDEACQKWTAQGICLPWFRFGFTIRRLGSLTNDILENIWKNAFPWKNIYISWSTNLPGTDLGFQRLWSCGPLFLWSLV